MQNRCCDSAGTDDCRCEEEQWVKVGQELPPNGKLVLWYDDADELHPFVVGKRDGQSVDWGGDLNQSLSSFTHWMYIPAAPR
jgi:hypothetical protein